MLGDFIRSVLNRRAELREQIQRVQLWLSRIPLENLLWRVRPREEINAADAPASRLERLTA